MNKNTPEPKKRSLGRPRKSETIKERTVNVYLPEKYMLKEWQQVAAEHKMSLSRFIIERVEDTLKEQGDGERYTRRDLIERNQTLERENGALRKELELKTKVIEALDQENKSLRNQSWLDPKLEGKRRFGRELIQLFHQRKKVTFDELLPALGVKPTEMESMKAINNQLTILTEYGLIQQDLKGWKWLL
jgi:hypothetical protein